MEKSWSDGNDAHDEDEIEVLIQRKFNGKTETFTSVYLSKDNDWKAGIDGLPTGYEYTVAEAKVPDGYTDAVSTKSEDGYAFAYIITNTVTTTPDPDPDPDPESEPEPKPDPRPEPEYGSLRIEKAIVGGGDGAASKTYAFEIRNARGIVVATRTITGAGIAFVAGLTPGTYTVTEMDADIDGFTWTCNITGSGEVVAGATVTVNVTNIYEESELDIPEEETPLVNIPEEEPPLVDIPEEKPPLVDIPEEEPPLFDIPEEDVPQSAVPQTGDNSGIWAVMAAMSFMGIVLLVLTGKRREENEEA